MIWKLLKKEIWFWYNMVYDVEAVPYSEALPKKMENKLLIY